jgi:hypothetical protein
MKSEIRGKKSEVRNPKGDVVERLYRAVEELEGKLARLYLRTPEIVSEAQQRRANLERLLTLSGMGDNQVWQTVLSYADEHARNEQQIALGPNLSDADRQYNAGRAGGALDFAMALRELRLKAEAAKDKRSDM